MGFQSSFFDSYTNWCQLTYGAFQVMTKFITVLFGEIWEGDVIYESWFVESTTFYFYQTEIDNEVLFCLFWLSRWFCVDDDDHDDDDLMKLNQDERWDENKIITVSPCKFRDTFDSSGNSDAFSWTCLQRKAARPSDNIRLSLLMQLHRNAFLSKSLSRFVMLSASNTTDILCE